MRTKGRGLLAALVLSLPATAAAADSIEIRHVAAWSASRCDRYARIAATGRPRRAWPPRELQFRVAGDGGWYSVAHGRRSQAGVVGRPAAAHAAPSRASSTAS